MQFKVPQNVQREDTIIGPLTLKQIGIIAVGGGIAYSIYVSLARTYFWEVWLPPVAIISLITLAFAFLTVHDMPFYQYVMHYIEYKALARKRHWVQGSDTPTITQFHAKKDTKAAEKVKKDQEKKVKNLEELSKVLDSGGIISNSEEEISQEKKKEELQKMINLNYKNS